MIQLTILETIGKNIRSSRLQLGLTQEQLALNSGRNQSYIGHIERGMKNPTILTLEKIASTLKVTLPELIISNEKKEHSKDNILSAYPEVEIKQLLLEILEGKLNKQ